MTDRCGRSPIRNKTFLTRRVHSDDSRRSFRVCFRTVGSGGDRIGEEFYHLLDMFLCE